MLARHHDPIVAVATAPGRGAVGIVRVSGRSLRAYARALLGQDLTPRHASYLPLRDARGEVLDHGIALYFEAPRSYTGEDVLELQVHGGPVVLQLLLARCLEAGTVTDAAGVAALPGLRLAQPGEFTQRAFLNDKLDLAQAEAVADLIDANTEAAARSASRSLDGAFSRAVTALLDGLVDLRMLVEATLDFPEEDIDFIEQANTRGRLAGLGEQLRRIMEQARQGSLLREGIRVVIAGQPNAGKSSLLNALAGAELAIVTPVPGTTRDKVQQTIQIEGVPLHVIDTAGLRDSDDIVERIGIERAWAEIEAADAVLFLHDLTRCDDPAYVQADAVIARRLAEPVGSPAGRAAIIHVWNKADAVTQGQTAPRGRGEGPEELLLSAKTGEGLESLRQALLRQVGWSGTSEGLFLARERHLHALRRTGVHLQAAEAHLATPMPALDLLAEELRLAQGSLGEITGEFTSDDLLGVIFSRFCIGK